MSLGMLHGLSLTCSRCGGPAPTPESAEFTAWRGSGAVLAGEVGDLAAGLLLCPECVAEDRTADELGGEG
jgi:hypothetical protein